LGKPTHNGFQERVFSRGVYLDGKLKKRLKEENFEMSVLNSFNEQRVSVIKQALQAKESKEYTGWMTDKLSKENQAKELLQFYKKDKISTRLEKDDNYSGDEDDGSVDSRTATDDESLGDFLLSKNFLEEDYVSPKKQPATGTKYSSTGTLLSAPEGEVVEL
jgi:NADH dehydrogenase/NADH:ubiquinone oxidoreductase subunit G